MACIHSILVKLAPRMVQHLDNIISLCYIAVEHAADQVDALIADCVWYSKVTIHDLVDAVEWVLLIDDGVEQDAQCPYILLLAIIWLASKDLRCSIIYRCLLVPVLLCLAGHSIAAQ